MDNVKICPKCESVYTYEDGHFTVCSECSHMWNEQEETLKNQIKDSNGNVLEDGDTVIVIKDLKVKGSSKPIKQGTRVKNIGLVHNPSDGHNISCKIDGFGSIKLKSEFVKK